MYKSNRLCRLCLEDGAELPIFETNLTDEKHTIITKITLCMNEKIEDIDGYPRNICGTCNNILDMVSSFINKYKSTCTILESQLLNIKQEDQEDGNDSCDGYSEAEIEIDQIKIEEDFTNVICVNAELENPIKLSKNITETLENSVVIKKVGASKSTKLTSKIASSILEGEFLWSGKGWCLKDTKFTSSKEEKTKIEPKPEVRSQRQKALTIKLPKPQTKSLKLCDVCGEVFKNRDRLSAHRKKHFKTLVDCTSCSKKFVSQYYLKRHIKRKHDKQRDFVCPICGANFAFKSELTSHHRRVHEKDVNAIKEKFKCNICDKSYKCRKSVVVHERSAHTGQRPAECTICGTSFFHEDYLKEHMRLHTGETPFLCPVCGRGYAQRCNMKSHLRIHRISELDAVTLSKIKPNYLKLLKA